MLFEPVIGGGANLGCEQRWESPSGVWGSGGPIHLPPVHSKHSLRPLASTSSPEQRQS